MVMHMGGSRTHSSNIVLSELAKAVESVEESIKDDDMYSISSTWRLEPPATQATCLYYQKFVCLMYDVYVGRGK